MYLKECLRHHIEKIKNKSEEILNSIEKADKEEIENYIKEIKNNLYCIEIANGKRVVYDVLKGLTALILFSTVFPIILLFLNDLNQLNVLTHLNGIVGLDVLSKVYFFIGGILLIYETGKMKITDCFHIGLGGYGDRDLQKMLEAPQIRYWFSVFKRSTFALVFLTYGFLFQVILLLKNVFQSICLFTTIAISCSFVLFLLLGLYKC